MLCPVANFKTNSNKTPKIAHTLKVGSCGVLCCVQKVKTRQKLQNHFQRDDVLFKGSPKYYDSYWAGTGFYVRTNKKNAAQNLHNFNSVASKRCFSQLLQNVPSGKFQWRPQWSCQVFPGNLVPSGPGFFLGWNLLFGNGINVQFVIDFLYL